MARSPLRKRILAISAFYAMYVFIRWWMMSTYHLCRSIESRTLRAKYLMSFHNRRDNMMRMVYESDITSVVNIRMNIHAFTTLCNMLESRGGLKDSKNMLVDEQVAMFLHTLAHNAKNRILVNRFHRSGETISRYFKLVLNAVCRLHKEFYKTPVPVPDNETDERWKWFKGCLGALDGTYVKVRVPAVDRKPYRTRKGEICTNVLGVCTRDLLFTYVLAGWEGSASDSRVLRDAISRPNGLKVTQGTYYLCDAGYTNGEGFLTPYRGQRYHLNDWSRPPTNAKELFNMRHSSARNVVERCLVHTSGFGWNEQKTCVRVDDENVWAEYVKSHKGAVNFKDKPFPFYEKLCTIFGKDRATGSKAIDLGEEDVILEAQSTSPIDIEDHASVEDVILDARQSESATSKRKRGKSASIEDVYRESCKEMKEVLVKFGEIVGEQFSKESMQTGEVYEKVSEEIRALPGITPTKRFKAAHKIGKDVVLGRSFLGLTQEEKIDMVLAYTDGSMG